MTDEQKTKTGRLQHLNQVANRALNSFSAIEKTIFLIAVIFGVVSVLSLIYKINDHFLVSIPMHGGTLNEGIVGTPRFVNPLLASTDADRDLSALIYRGLMKNDANGLLVPDLADSYNVSNDGLTYTFVLKDAYFQDGEKLTADDVVFTVTSAQNATLKSAARVSWGGVLVKALDEKTVVFTLKQPYAPFLENTVLGILPKHIWSKVPYENWVYSDFNTNGAIGEGLYQIHSISQNATGIPEYYELTATKAKNATVPLITTIRMHFYSNEESLLGAYKKGDIDTAGGIDPENAEALAHSGAEVLTSPLPRVFGLFFNQSQAKIFTDGNVRKAISLAIKKDEIVQDVLHGYGTIDQGPIPENSPLHKTQTTPSNSDIAQAKKILEKGGWKLGDDGIYVKQNKKDTTRLSFEIATNDTPELTQSVELISKQLLLAGIEAKPKVYETGSLNQDIIRPRKFQALFFGEVVSTQSDLYAFWHSSQRADPGLNISGYANAKVDKLLTQGLSTIDPAKTASLYDGVISELQNDTPAVFVYTPAYIYVVRPNLTGISLGHINTTEDRFSNISTWYLATDKVWKIFAKK